MPHRQPQDTPRDGEWSPARRQFLRIASCTAIGVGIAVIDRIQYRWRLGQMREAEERNKRAALPENPLHRQLIEYLMRDDAGFALVAQVFANKCWEFPDDPRMTGGCERLWRLGLATGGEEGDRIAEAAVVGLAGLRRTELLVRLAGMVHERSDLPRTRRAVTRFAGERRR